MFKISLIVNWILERKKSYSYFPGTFSFSCLWTALLSVFFLVVSCALGNFRVWIVHDLFQQVYFSIIQTRCPLFSHWQRMAIYLLLHLVFQEAYLRSMLFAQHLLRLADRVYEVDETTQQDLHRPAQEALMKLFAVSIKCFT